MPTGLTEDQTYAREIQDARKNFNRVVASAVAAGLAVEIIVITYESAALGEYSEIDAKVSRPIK